VDDAPTALISRDQTTDGRLDPTSPSSYPLITVGMVAHNPGAWFTEVLESLAAQDYAALEIVVVDAASDIPVAPRVHAVLPEATVIPLVANQGFAKNANTLLDHPGLGPYVLLLHDDVALSPDCVRRLIEEAVRSNAGIVGPKLLDWNDPNLILHVGLGADKTGLVSDLAEPGEYDQEQHDAVRDVFAVPGAVTLVRTDLFQTLGGFDEAMVVQGEDLDLCWRAHVLGARVLVNPEATARHREDLSTRIVGHDRGYLARRHRIRSLMSNYGMFHTLRVVPQAIAASMFNMVVALLQGRVGLLREIMSAWTWNFARFGSIAKRRRALREHRQVDDADVRALQIPGFEGWQAWRRRRADRRAVSLEQASATEVVAFAAERRRWFQITLGAWAAVVALLLFGSRGLIRDELPIINQFVGFPDGPGPLLGEWQSTWRSTGLGSEAPSSLLHFFLGVAGIGLFGQMGFLRLLVTLGLIFVGAVGIYRAVGPFRSRLAQLVALLVYAAAPLPYNALVGGSWSGLVAYAALPWLARRLAMAAGIEPFIGVDSSPVRRLADSAIVAMILATAALVEPAIFVAFCILALGWVLGGLSTSHTRGLLRLPAATIGALVLGFIFLAPASLEFFSSGDSWSPVSRSARPGDHSLTELLRFATGPHGASWIGWVLLVVPALALALTLGQRLVWAARSWFTVVLSWGAAWASQQGFVDWLRIDVHVLLAPAAVGLAFAAGMASAALGFDLQRHRFGWRQLVPIVAVAALVVSAFAGVGGAFHGRWMVVEDGYESVLDFLDDKAPAHARALWLGEASVLPVEGWRFDDRLTWSITNAREPTVLDEVGPPQPAAEQVATLIHDTLQGSSSRLGARLAPFGVRYVVLVDANAPSPYGDDFRPIDPVVRDRLAQQLDLVRLEVRSGATIFENRAYVPTVASFPADTLITSQSPSTADLVSTPYALALPEVASLRSYSGPISAGELFVSVPSSQRWSLTVDDQPALRSRALDWATVFRVDEPGIGELRHANHLGYTGAGLVQVLLWGFALLALILGRRRAS